MKKITVITGHYGSGKTNFSVNLAMKSAEAGLKTAVVDLDIVNPYFRLADFKNFFSDKGITLAAPQFANTSLDIPALNFNMEVLYDESDHLIVDVGGDDSGAVALGGYSSFLKNVDADFEMLCVINKYRYMDSPVDETVALVYDIEKASRLKHTGIINNSNLGCETTEKTVEDSILYAKKVSEMTGLPLMYTAYPDSLKPDVENSFPVGVYVKPIWDR